MSKNKNNKNQDLVNAAKTAKQQGLTYGQWQAKQFAGLIQFSRNNEHRK